MEKATFEQARDIIRNLLWEARKDYRLHTDSGIADKAEDSLYWGRVQALRNALEKLDAL